MRKTFSSGLYLVTDRGLSLGRPLAQIVRQAVLGGVTMVQLREKECPTAEFVALARELKEVLRGTGVPLIINDRVDVALASGADGVHLGQGDLDCAAARRLLGPGAIIGLSVENEAQATESTQYDIDYVAVSPVFSTPTKTDAPPALGLEGIVALKRASARTTVAIGGINRTNIAQVMAAGADGVAVVSAVCSAQDVAGAARELKKLAGL